MFTKEKKMLKLNPNFNYNFYDKLFDLKQNESDSIFDVVHQIMEIFCKVYSEKSTNKGVYYLGKEIKYTSDIDPTYCLSIKYAIGTVQDLYIDLPLVQNGDTILINGNIYNPMLQMIDKPLYMKEKNHSAVLQTNLGIFSTTEIDDEKVIRLNASLNSMFHPPVLLYFIHYLGGLDGFEKYTGVKVNVEPGCHMTWKEYCDTKMFLFDKSHIKPEFKDPKFDILLNQFNRLKLLYRRDFKMGARHTDLFKRDINDAMVQLRQPTYTASLISEYMPASNLKKFDVHQELVYKFDIFSRAFMKKPNIWEELLRAFTNEVHYLDIKDLNNKRFRCYELYLLTFLKHIYNLGMNTLYSKIATVSKEKRLRIYDNIRGSTTSNIKDTDGKSPAYSYDGGRNNSIMRLTEMTKINQTGEGGLTSQMFVGAARDLHDSQYGTLCPITTPDREKCGVTLYLCPSNITKFPDMYYWPKKDDHKDIRQELLTDVEYKKLIDSLPKKETKIEKPIDLPIDDDSDEEDEVKDNVIENSSDSVDTGEEIDTTSLFLTKFDD